MRDRSSCITQGIKLMPVEYMEFEQAREAQGLRMIVVGGVPSPWGEAAKGILHVKQIPWKAVRLDQGSDAMAGWTGERSGPVAMYEDEAPRSGWDEILLLAERLAPTPELLPPDPLERARLLGLSHEICGEDGLGWARRLQGVHASLNGAPSFPPAIARYLADKYAYRADAASQVQRRVLELLRMLADLLHAQKKDGSRFYSGKRLSVVDLYSATFISLFEPLPPDQCAMMEPIRAGYAYLDEATKKALDPILTEHRDFIYEEFLELPLTL
ncbi:MAG: hypothetical protein ABGX04_02215 [Myxococcales bacterium]